ncbi:MAG: hypothetical protein ABUS51_08015, partial [Acidobacteriota bacterium]
MDLVKIPGIHKQRAALFLVVALALLDILFVVTGTASFLAILLSVGLVGYGMFQLTRTALRRSHLIWRLRNRLIVTYMFIGAVPILLILALSFCGVWIVVGQVATYLIRSELTRRATLLADPARVLSEARAQDRNAMVTQMGPLFQERAPGVEILVTGRNGEPPLRCPPGSNIEPLPAEWKPYTGLVYKDGNYYVMSLAEHAGTRALLLAPLGPEVLAKLVPGIGSLAIVDVDSSQLQARKADRDKIAVAGTVPPAYNVLDWEFIWLNPLEAAHWRNPNKPESVVLKVNTRPSAVLNVVFGDRVDAAQDVLVIFVGLTILLALMELGSAAIGFSMTTSITGAVHNLYEGTLRIGRGDFSHR